MVSEYSHFLFPKLYSKTREGLLRISSFELLTWKVPEVDDRVLYEWIVEVFSNKFRRFGGELLLFISCIRLATDL